jgi:hypothetical protein
VVSSTPPSICGPCWVTNCNANVERRKTTVYPAALQRRNVLIMTLYQVRLTSNKGVHVPTTLDRDAILQSREVVATCTTVWGQPGPDR